MKRCTKENPHDFRKQPGVEIFKCVYCGKKKDIWKDLDKALERD